MAASTEERKPCAYRMRTLRHKIQRLIYGIWMATIGRPATRVGFVLVCLAVCSAAALHYAEKGHASAYGSIGRTFCSVVVLLLSGFDVAPPTTKPGWGLAIFTMLLGIAFVAVVTADLASHLVRIAMRPWSQSKVNVKDHFLITGWGRNDTGLLSGIVNDDLPALQHVVIVDDKLEQPPVKDPYAHFIRGDPTEEAVLERAGVRRATVTLIPLDWRIQSDTLKDSVNTLIMLAVEGCNPETYSCVEIVRRDSKRHLSRTAANEVICVGDLSVHLLTQAALNPGLSLFLNQLLSADRSVHMHKKPLPSCLVGWTFRQVFALLNEQLQEVLLAIERQAGGRHAEIFANPRGAFALVEGDQLFLLGRCSERELIQVAENNCESTRPS